MKQQLTNFFARAPASQHYCAEQFSNDGTQPSSIMKALKRTMTVGFGRELSVKIFDGAGMVEKWETNPGIIA
jgi:hypothetical protein